MPRIQPQAREGAASCRHAAASDRAVEAVGVDPEGGNGFVHHLDHEAELPGHAVVSGRLTNTFSHTEGTERTEAGATEGVVRVQAMSPRPIGMGARGYMHENEISGIVVDSALLVHRELGPGLLESVYEVALAHVLRERGLRLTRQQPIPVVFRGITFDTASRS